jgi:septation ring formation regulator EzrA
VDYLCVAADETRGVKMTKIKKAKTSAKKLPVILADELEMSIVVDAVDAGLKRECAAKIRELENRIIELEEVIDGQQTSYSGVPF